MCFKDLESPVKFELENVLSLGVGGCTFHGYSILIVLSEEDANRISDLAKENGAIDPTTYGKLIYLRFRGLSDKQKKDLLNKGRTNILLHFNIVGVYTENGISYLVPKVCKLQKLEGPTVNEEEVPED